MASLQEVTEELQTQTKSIDSLVSVIEKQIKREAAGAGDDLEARLKAGRSKGSSSGPSTFKGGLVGAVKSDLGIGFAGNLLRWAMGGISGALGALGVGTLTAGLVPMLGAMIGRLLIRGPLGAALLLFGEDLFTKAFDFAGLEEYVTIDIEDKKLYAASLSKAIGSGLIAGIFNKKLGLAVFIGSLLGDAIKGLFSDESLEENFISGFGLNFSKEQFITYGSMFAAFFAPSLIRGALSSALGLGASMLGRGGRRGPGAAPTGKAKAGFLKGFKPRGFKGLGWAGMLMFTGSLLADYIGDLTGSQTAHDLISIGTTGLTIAALLGPTPIGIAAAIAAMAVHGILLAKNHIDKKRAEMDAAFEAEVNRITNEEVEPLTPDATILRAMELAALAGKRASSGVTVDPNSEEAAREEAFIRRLQSENPDALGKAFLQEEIGYLTGEYDRLKAMGSPTTEIANQLKQRLVEMEGLTGKPSEQLKMLNSEQANTFPTPAPGQDTGTFLSIPNKPVLEDFKKWWKSERKENYDFQKALQKYNMEMSTLMPPPQIQSGMGLGGGFVANDNRVSNSGSVVYQQSAATRDVLRGGSGAFSIIGTEPLVY